MSTLTQKHTPGPWGISHGRTLMHIGGDAHVCSISKSANHVERDSRVAFVAQQMANARLIAAAPDLLEALKDLLEHACIADAAPEDVDEEDRALERAARAAIKKAES